MAIYHLSVKPISRAGGSSATAASAYRSAERIEDRTSGEVFDYTRRSGVEHTEIVLSTQAAKQDINWARDRQTLWNEAEKAEKRRDARVAREYEVALPAELNKAQRLALTREFAQELANQYGNAVDFAIHRPHWSGDERNHHAHILTTTRKVEATGLGAKTDIELADADRAKKGLGPAKKEITSIRERWAQLSNRHLERAGHKARIDHRTLEAQGIDREPTVHLGPAVNGLSRKGKDSTVLERIAEQRAQDAQQRLQRAVELGKLERERVEVERSILVLDGDIRSALATRDMLSKSAKAPTPEELRQQAREKWAEMQKGRGAEPTPSPGNAPAASVSKGLDFGQGAAKSPATDKGKGGGRDGPGGGIGL
jgi:ATP-dependent exoDNAse (exonuclease V) alpha subunit